MSDSQDTIIKSGPAIPDQIVEEVTTDKQVVINISDEGGIKVDFNGELKTHEVFGSLFVTLMDMGVQNFINPHLATVIKETKNSEISILESLKQLGVVVAEAAVSREDTQDISSTLKNILNEAQGIVANRHER